MKLKTNYQLLKEIRRTWSINPKTRVKEDKRKNKKKIRENNRKEIYKYV